MPSAKPIALGRYEGEPRVKLLPDGRNVQLLDPLVYIDSKNMRWAVPPLSVVDGASIPRIFWSLIGAPLDGSYRDASIIHDWFCDRRTRTWQATHWVFYEAMLVSGVSPLTAKTMYFAVRWRGPRWEARVSHNTNLTVDDEYNFSRNTVIDVPSPGESLPTEIQAHIMTAMKQRIESEDLSIDKIEALSE